MHEKRTYLPFLATALAGSASIKIAMLFALSVLFAGCNTWSGFGKDLQHLGKNIEDRANQSPSTDR